MSKHVQYQTQGTCSRLIDVVVSDDGVIEDLRFEGGCNGNLKGICTLVKGQKAEDVISKLEGITCGVKPTSCPDQLAHALRQVMGS